MSVFTVRLLRTVPLGPEDFVTLPSGEVLQICRAAVDTADGVKSITLFLASDAAPLTLNSLVTVLAAEASGTIGALVRTEADGRATVELAREHGAHTPAVAAATAVMRASWAWDESPTIIVTVNGATIPVAPRFTDDGWTATGIAPPAV